jgi:nicotinate-nucleotide adenylyltransferase
MNSVHKKIALFGGSFNPPHRAHRQVLEYVKNLGTFDKIWVLPVYTHPFEKDLATFEDREAMCRLLIQGLEPGVKVCSVEKESKRNPSYTIDTVSDLKLKYPDTSFTLVIGSDCKKDLPRWKDAEKLKQMVDFLFVPRPGFEASSFQDISSSEIRKHLSKGEDISGFVLPKIAEYIRKHQLYR